MEMKDILKDARNKAGFTQEQAAERILVTRQTISNWENGKSLPDIVSVLKMSDLYQVSLDELLKGDQKMVEKIEKDEKGRRSGRTLMVFAFAMILIGCVSNVFTIMRTGQNITSMYMLFLSGIDDVFLVLAGVCALVVFFVNRHFETMNNNYSKIGVWSFVALIFINGVIHVGSIFSSLGWVSVSLCCIGVIYIAVAVAASIYLRKYILQ